MACNDTIAPWRKFAREQAYAAARNFLFANLLVLIAVFGMAVFYERSVEVVFGTHVSLFLIANSYAAYRTLFYYMAAEARASRSMGSNSDD